MKDRSIRDNRKYVSPPRICARCGRRLKSRKHYITGERVELEGGMYSVVRVCVRCRFPNIPGRTVTLPKAMIPPP